MALSFTERKRIRKDFGKRPSILDAPYLLAIQVESYRDFLQAESRPGSGAVAGGAEVMGDIPNFTDVTPVVQISENVA